MYIFVVCVVVYKTYQHTTSTDFTMRHFRKYLFSLVFAVTPYIACASSIVQLDITELLQNSELVFAGQVISKESQWNANKTNIFTNITFQVDDVIVGRYPANTLILRFVGGTVDQDKVTIEGSNVPSLDESGVYFVSSTSEYLVNPIVGWAQGHFLTQKDSSGTMRMMTQSQELISGVNLLQKKSNYLSEGVATGITHSTATDISQAMNLDDFKEVLRQTAASLTPNVEQ